MSLVWFIAPARVVTLTLFSCRSIGDAARPLGDAALPLEGTSPSLEVAASPVSAGLWLGGAIDTNHVMTLTLVGCCSIGDAASPLEGTASPLADAALPLGGTAPSLEVAASTVSTGWCLGGATPMRPPIHIPVSYTHLTLPTNREV